MNPSGWATGPDTPRTGPRQAADTDAGGWLRKDGTENWPKSNSSLRRGGPERVTQAAWNNEHEHPRDFASVMGPRFDLSKLPATAKLLITVVNGRSGILQVRQNARTPAERPLHSYPSAHTTIGYSVAVVLAALILEHVQGRSGTCRRRRFSREGLCRSLSSQYRSQPQPCAPLRDHAAEQIRPFSRTSRLQKSPCAQLYPRNENELRTFIAVLTSCGCSGSPAGRLVSPNTTSGSVLTLHRLGTLLDEKDGNVA